MLQVKYCPEFVACVYVSDVFSHAKYFYLHTPVGFEFFILF